VWQTPQVDTFIKISLPPGTGAGISTSTRGFLLSAIAPTLYNIIAFISPQPLARFELPGYNLELTFLCITFRQILQYLFQGSWLTGELG
jgi:hypothetical protein